MKITKITGYTVEYSVEDSINERIEHFENDYDVRVINVKVTKDGESEFCEYSVWLELRRREDCKTDRH